MGFNPSNAGNRIAQLRCGVRKGARVSHRTTGCGVAFAVHTSLEALARRGADPGVSRLGV